MDMVNASLVTTGRKSIQSVSLISNIVNLNRWMMERGYFWAFLEDALKLTVHCCLFVMCSLKSNRSIFVMFFRCVLMPRFVFSTWVYGAQIVMDIREWPRCCLCSSPRASCVNSRMAPMDRPTPSWPTARANAGFRGGSPSQWGGMEQQTMDDLEAA